MSYHRDYHEFDFDSDLIDAVCPMTDLDHLIAQYGTEEALKKLNKPSNQVDDIVRLEARDNGNPEYIDYVGDIVGNVQRGICFVLTYVVEHHSFYATISDTGESAYEEDIKDIPHEVAEFLVGEEEYNKLKEIHREHLESHGQTREEEPASDLKNAFKEVIRLARAGQQPWWTEDLKKKSDKSINKLESYYNEKYDK